MSSTKNLNKFKQYLKLNVSSKNTAQTYYYQMKQFFDNLDVFNQENIDEYFSIRLDDEISKSTFNQINKAMRKYQEFMKTSFDFPKLRREDKKVRVFISEKEMKETILPMFSLIFKNYLKRNLVFKFMFYTGLRLEELLKLETNDFDIESKTFVVKNTKGKKDRKLPIPKHLLSDIENIIKYQNNSENIFNINKSWIKTMFRRINEDLKLSKKLSPHILRHSFAKHCLQKGIDVIFLQKLLGHSDIKTTMIYANPTEDEAIDIYHKKIRG